MSKSWTAAMKEFFGTLGKPLTEFAKEIKALSFKERLEFHEMLKGQGIDCDVPMNPETTQSK